MAHRLRDQNRQGHLVQLDLLLTSATITDARKETKRRLGEGAREIESGED